MRSLIVLVSMILMSCHAGRMIETDLYFGMSKPGGGIVSEQEWADFIKQDVGAVFKEGSTVIPARGHWRDPQNGSLITESTRVLIYFHKKSKTISQKIDGLREVYKDQFNQQSVLRVDKKVNARFE